MDYLNKLGLFSFLTILFSFGLAMEVAISFSPVLGSFMMTIPICIGVIYGQIIKALEDEE